MRSVCCYCILLLLSCWVGEAYYLPSSSTNNFLPGSTNKGPRTKTSRHNKRQTSPSSQTLLALYRLHYRPLSTSSSTSLSAFSLSSDLVVSVIPAGVSSSPAEASSILFSGSIFNDMLLAAVLSIMSDCIAQFSTSPKMLQDFKSLSVTYDMPRTTRFAMFGFIDGAIGHTWYYALEIFIKDTRLVDIINRILADALVS